MQKTKINNPVYAVCLSLQEAEIKEFCFDKCGQISIGGITFNDLAWCPCHQKDCPYLDREISVGKAPFDWGEQELILRKLKPTLPKV